MRKSSVITLVLSLIFVMAFTAVAQAGISGTAPNVVSVAAPSLVQTNVGPESNTQIVVFPERQNVTLASAVGSLAAGTLVNSYLIHFDPVGSSSTLYRLSGSVTFDETILEVLRTDAQLNATDGSLGAPGTTYVAGGRQLEYTTNPSPSGTADYVAVSGSTINVNWGATTAADSVRVLTEGNRPPAVAVDYSSVTANEGNTAANTGTVSDPDGDSVGLSASVGTVINNNDGTWSWSFDTSDGPAENQSVTIYANDGSGGTADVTFQLTVNNVPPSIDTISVPAEPVNFADQPISASATFSDPGGTYDELYTCTVNYGDGSGDLSGTVSGMTCIGPDHSYAEANVYKVTVTVTDKDGGSDTESAVNYVVIYDPTGGFVTGGGWIWSPPGALADAGLEYPDFSSTAGLNLVADATSVGGALRLAGATYFQGGAAWYQDRQFVEAGFTTSFAFQISNSGGTGADGLTFIIQNEGDNVLGSDGGFLGYQGLANAVAIEFDTWYNGASWDPSGQHISVQTNGSVLLANSLGYANIPSIEDGQVHQVRIDYVPGSMDIYLDDMVTPVLTVAVDLADQIDLEEGHAWVGFTAATGGAYANHDILNWSYMSDASTVEGKANFGFNSKYKKGATVPTGKTEFNFKAGGLNFHSDTYEWLVVNQGGTNASFKGDGTINNEFAPNGELYKFKIWATDNGSGQVEDTFRIRIWYEDGGSEITVYDNGVEQEIGGGNIAVHAN